MRTEEPASPPPSRQPPVPRRLPGVRFGLSGKLLLLTVLFVMVAEVAIYLPSIANFRLNWLRDRLAAAHTAALVLDAAPSNMMPEALTRQILDSVGARAVAMKTGDQRRLLAAHEMPDTVKHEVDIRAAPAWQAIADAFTVLLSPSPGTMRVIGPAPAGGQFIEVILDEAPLRAAMLRFSVNILLLSLIISAITATLVYLALHYLFVRPMRRITANLTSFHQDPESPTRIIAVSGRRDEIGLAESELADMQRDLVSMLHQKNRLAALGLAVSKINHDLRNLLASAQLISDQLAGVPDAKVQRFAPKLMRTLERAVAYCQSTLSYGRAQEAPPERRLVAVEAIVREVREQLDIAAPGQATSGQITWVNAIEHGLLVDADPEHLFRILLNLARNAVQALDASDGRGGARQIRVTGRREGAVAIMEISDTGPGVPDKARAHLFEAFQGSARAGGTGLGLAIAAELVRAHDGEIRLVEGTMGATFRIAIPDRPIILRAPRERSKA